MSSQYISYSSRSGGGGSTTLTIGTIDSTSASANGAVISGSNLIMQSASASVPGLVSTAAQTFAGNKTFSGNILGVNSASVDGSALVLVGGSATAGLGNGGDVTVSGGTSAGGLPGIVRVQGLWLFDKFNSQFQPSPNTPAFLIDVSAISPNNSSFTMGSADYNTDLPETDLYFQTGSNTTVGAGNPTGSIIIYSGNITDATATAPSGTVQITTGDNLGVSNSGNVVINTGRVTGDGRNTGDITLQSGPTTNNGSTGRVLLLTNNGRGAGNSSGDIQINPATGIDGASDGIISLIGRVQLFSNNQPIAAGDHIASNFPFNRVQSAGAVSTNATTPIDAGTATGQVLVLVNVGANNITIKAGGNVELPGLLDYVLAAKGSISFIYDGSSWVTTCASIN